MKTQETIISRKLRSLYSISIKKDTVIIGSPAFVNIDKDDGFEITQNETVLRISNSKVLVTLWKSFKMQHITIL